MSKKKTIGTHIIALCLIALLPAVRGAGAGETGPGADDILFLHHKGRDNLSSALKAASAGAASARDRLMAEVWLFRLMEIIRHPELIDGVLTGIQGAVETNPVIGKDPWLSARGKLFMADLLLRKGRSDEAKKLVDSLGMLREVLVIGPFEGASPKDFLEAATLEKWTDFSGVYRGKNGPARWFKVRADLLARIDFGQLFPSIGNSVFYLHASVKADTPGGYYLSFGKHGAASVWVDGVKVFSSVREHGYLPDQYRVPLELEAGWHGILVKTAGTSEGCSVSLRVTDRSGKPLPGVSGHGGPSGTLRSMGGPSYFESLSLCTDKENPGAYESFLAGYLFHAAKLESRDGREALTAFSRAMEDPLLGPYARYYGAVCEREAAAREAHLLAAVDMKKDFIEALAALAQHRLDYNLLYEAYPIVKKIREINPDSLFAGRILGEYHLGKTWYLEGEKTGGSMLKSGYPSAGHALLGRIRKVQGDYTAGAEHFKRLYGMDRLDTSSFNSLVDCLEKTGRYSEACDYLSSALTLYPSGVDLRLRLAKLADKIGGAEKSVPYLSSAYVISPENAEVLLALGETYHRLGKSSAARNFLGQAVIRDPNNFQLKRYVSFLYGQPDALVEYRINTDIDELARAASKYHDEAAVVLLDETIYRVFADGSHEKRVRAAYLVNQASAIQDFSRHSILINPETDRIESVVCAVINGAERVESSETRSQSLSDPDSRLYYNVEAHVVSAPSLRPGSIVDFEYTVKSRRESEYEGHFGGMISTGGKYRVLKANIVLSAPSGMDVRCHLNNVDGKRLVVTHRGDEKIFHIRLDGVPPLREESSMPHRSESLPSAMFTTHRDWDGMYRWYYGLLRSRVVASDAMKRDLAALIAPGDTPREKVRKIFNYVTRRIRYVGFELGIGSIRPRRAEETYGSGMGDCKDISLVLVALLREAGIDARVALIRTADRGRADISVPWVGVFNHAICYVNIDGGFFIDGTAELSGYREIPEYDRGVPALVMDERGYRIIDVESVLFERNLLEITNEVVLGADGGASVTRIFHKQGGMYAPGGRYSLQEESGILKNISEFWNGAYPGSEISGFTVIEKGPENPVRYRYDVKVPSFGQVQDGTLVFKSMMIPTEVFSNYGSARTRKYPLFLGGTFESVETIRYRLPEGFSALRAPESGKFGGGDYGAWCTSEVKDGGRLIEVTHRVKYGKSRIGPGEYEDFREMLKFIHAAENEMIILMKNGVTEKVRGH